MGKLKAEKFKSELFIMLTFYFYKILEKKSASVSMWAFSIIHWKINEDMVIGNCVQLH
jgi:hypothetical protein